MRSVQLNLIAEPNDANGEEFASKNNALQDAGTRHPPHLRIVHSLLARSQTGETLELATDCSKALALVDKLQREALERSRQSAEVLSDTKVRVHIGTDSRARHDSGKVAKDRSSKHHRNPHAGYEERKKQWDQQHPYADSEQRDVAIRRIAKECGV